MGQAHCGSCTISSEYQTESLFSSNNNDRYDLPPGQEDDEEALQPKENETVYRGDYVDGVRHGHGLLILPDGGRYEGEFRDGKRAGFGTFWYPSGSIFKGQWENDLQHGQGEEEWADGSRYLGLFVTGAKHGHGIFTWPSGCRYEGNFDRNAMHGEGTYAWSDGREYVGMWRANRMEPQGKMWWPDGRHYDGEFKDGRKHGEGELRWADGACYRGEWVDGVQHGQALWCHPKSNGQLRHSQWKDGKFVCWLDTRSSIANNVATSSFPSRNSINNYLMLPTNSGGNDISKGPHFAAFGSYGKPLAMQQNNSTNSNNSSNSNGSNNFNNSAANNYNRGNSKNNNNNMRQSPSVTFSSKAIQATPEAARSSKKHPSFGDEDDDELFGPAETRNSTCSGFRDSGKFPPPLPPYQEPYYAGMVMKMQMPKPKASGRFLCCIPKICRVSPRNLFPKSRPRLLGNEVPAPPEAKGEISPSRYAWAR